MSPPQQTPLPLAKIIVSVAALVILVLHLTLPADRKLDTAGIGLVFLAVLPWLGTILTRAELPGGWKFEFQQVKTEQRRQAQEIDAIKFLLSNFLTEHECRHLEGLASEKPYLVSHGGTTHFFEMEMRRLRSLGFISGRPERGVGSLLAEMMKAGGKAVDAKGHFEATPRGLDYLRLRREMLTTPPSEAPDALAEAAKP